ncbi:hypothetical protein Hanom_Chr13g01202001 [Helianthus anomalus]
MHLNQLATVPTPIFFRGWLYRLYKNFVQRMPKSFCKCPWSGKADLVICRSMEIINDAGDGTVRCQPVQGHVWNRQEALVLHAAPICPPPQFQGHAGSSSSQGGGFPNFQSLHDLLQENLLCTRNTYNMANDTYTQVGAIERNISDIQDGIGHIQEHMVFRGGDADDEDMD